ncbi:hypothetical protein IQ07DRAFT_497354, partial [Pyrenochaeta sp. DS3sAY3a]
LKKKYHHRPLYGVGPPVGANIITNVGEWYSCPLKAAIVSSNSWGLKMVMTRLQQSWID